MKVIKTDYDKKNPHCYLTQIIYSILRKIYMNNILVTGYNGQLGNELRLVVGENDKVNHYYFTDLTELDITNKEAVLRYLESNKINDGSEYVANYHYAEQPSPDGLMQALLG